MGLLAVFCFWSWLKTTQWLGAIIAGLTLGLAELCKFTLLLWYPLFPLLWLVYRLAQQETVTAREWLRQGGMLALLMLVSVYVVNCGYLFEGSFTPLEQYRFRTAMFSGCDSNEDVPREGANRFVGTWLGKLNVPLPSSMVQGIDTQRYDFERGRPSYLCGRWADRGWWYFYLYALAVKVPLGTWALVVLAIIATIFGRGYNAPWRDEMLLLAPGLAILVFVSSQTGFTIHSRYVIPALPFLLVWSSKAACVFEMQSLGRRRWIFAATVIIAVTSSITSSLWAYPHNLSYFNEIVGGPRRGGEYMLSSNFDWGQDLCYLKDWLEGHPDVKLAGLAYWNSYPATMARIPKTPRPDWPSARLGHAGNDSGPMPGWFALSANCLHDRSSTYRTFLHFDPIATAGYSVNIYYLTLEEANLVRRELGLPELREGWERDCEPQ